MSEDRKKPEIEWATDTPQDEASSIALIEEQIRKCDEKIRRAERKTQLAAPAEARCESCGGNDADMPCAYPGEGKSGCLRDARLQSAQGQRQPDGPITNYGTKAAAGCKLVPTEATDAMMQAAWDMSNAIHGTPEADDPLPRHLYRAMVDAAPPQPETWKVLPSPADAGPIRQLIAIHAEMREVNPYCYFELAYTRSTDWMAFICDKPAGGTVGTPEFGAGRKILAQGQGQTPEDACLHAARYLAESRKSTGELKQEAVSPNTNNNEGTAS